MATRTISTLEELKAFRDEVNAGNTFKGETIELANDIDLGGEEWTPIGHYQGGSFNGTFNGNGHTIKGLNIGNQSYGRGTGFFGETFTAVIKDLTIEGNINTNTDYVGGIVGHGYATITNCNFIGSIRSSASQVGGIAGSGGFTITNCTVDGNISGASWVGGIIGNCQDGGAYTNCYVKGEISADYAWAGVGAAGIAAIPLYTTQVISNCYSDTVTKNAGKEVNAPIIGGYNATVTADTKTFLTNNSWNKEKNSNDSFGICGADNADPTVPVNNVSRSNNLIAVASDLLYVEPGTLTIAHGSALTQQEILDTLNNTGNETKGAVVDPDGTIRFVNYVASLNGTKYETLEDAVAAAQDGDTITLLSDISLDQTLTIDKAVTIESAAGSAFTIKAGDSMVATAFNSMSLLNIKNAGVTLKNLTFDGNGQKGMTLIWTNQAKGLTLDTCTLQNSRNAIYAGSYNGGTVKINNCNIIAQIYAFNGTGMDKVEVTGSEIYGWTSFSSSNVAAEAFFKDCFFGAGDDTGVNGLVAALRPYFNAIVEDCTFTEAFTKFTEGYYEENGLSLGAANTVMDLTNCKIVTESGEESTLALAKLISTDYTAAAGNANLNTAFAFDAVKDENGKYISGIFCGDSEVITKNLAAGLAAKANEDGTYTPTAVDMSTFLVNEEWTETSKVGDLVQEGFYFGVNAFAKANDAINAAGTNATIKIQDARDDNTPITRASYTENLTIEAQKNSSRLYMTVSGKTYTYGEEDENGNAVRHDAMVEYKGQDIFFGGHSHFESLAGMTVKFTNSEITHEGGTPFFKVYGDSNVVFDGANYANDNGNLWFYVSGQLDLQNSSNLETDGGSGFRILAAGGKVNVDKSSHLQVIGSNISIGSYYVYSNKTAKAVVGGKKQGHDADGNNDYSATLNITNGSNLVNVNGIVRVGASYILDNATTDELEGLTITENPDKPANYADLAKACLNITDGSGAELNRLYVDGNGVVTIRNSELTANSITLADGSSLTLDAASAVTTGTLTNNGTITIDATGVTSGTHKVIDTDAIAGTGSIIAKDGTLADDMNLVISDNDVYVTDQDQSVVYVGGVNAAGEKSANTAAPAEALQGWNKFDTMRDAFKAGALGNNTIDFGNAGRVISDKAFAYTPETIELGKGEYTITNGAGAYLPRLTMNSKDVVVNIKNAHVTLSKYRSGKDSNGELGGASLNITDSRVDGGNEVDGLMWVTSYADSTIEITNSRVGLRDSYTGEAENVTLGNTGSYLDWGSYGNLALKVSGTAVINDSTIFAGYYFSTIGDADGATIDVTNSVVYASAVETDGTNRMASLHLNNSALRQSGWGNGSENYNFLVKKGATVSLTNGSNLWWARAAQVRGPYGGELRDSVVIDNGGTLELFYESTAEVGNITNNGKLVIYESTLKAMNITNNNYFAINNNSAITAEFSAAGTGFITVQDATFGADTVINSTASYTNQGIGSEILMFGTNILADGANISTGWSKDLRIGFGTNFPTASIYITSGAKLTVGGNTYIGSVTEDQSDAAYTVFVTGKDSEFNGSGAGGDLYLRADGMLTIENNASASFTYFNGKGVLNVLNATFKSLNFNIADSGRLTFANGAKATLGSSDDAKKNSTARGDISVQGDDAELTLSGDIKYGRTSTAADFTVKNNATVTVDGNIEIGYFTQTSGTMSLYKGSLSLADNARFTAAGTITVFLESALAMDYTSRLTFGGLTAQVDSITINVSGYTDGVYKVMENTGANAVDYATVISNWSEIENIGYTIVDNSLYLGKADQENYLVNADYSKYNFGDAIEGKAGYFYGFNAFSSLDEAGRAAKEATRTITVEADLAEDVNTPLFDLKGDLILTAETAVTVTWNVIGNAADAPDTDGKFYLVSKDGQNHTFTIGENVTLNVPASSWGGAFYVGYQSIWATKLNIDGKVNTYLFYIGSKSEVTISETGSLTTTSENLIMRRDSKLTVNGNGTLDESNPQVKLSYASIQGGDLVLNNTVMNAGSYLQMWNRNKVDSKQAPTLTMDNSILIANGLTARDAEEAVISLSNNSTVKINGNAANAGTMSVTDSVLYVDGTLTNSGTLNVYGESTISTVYVANTGKIILNDGTTLVDSTIMDSTENTVAYGNVTVRDGYFGTLVFSGNSGASVNGTLEGNVYVDKLMVDRRYNDAVSDDITGTLTVKAGANVGVNDRMYNKVGSTTVIEANAIVTVIGELQNKGIFNVEGTMYLFSENGLGESVAGRDKNKGVMNVNGGKVYYADGSSSNGWFGIGAKIHNAGWQDVEEAGSEMNLSNNALLDLTFNGGNEYPDKYGAAFAIGTGATLNVESGSTVDANSALLNKGTVNLDETSKITVGDLLNEASGKINVKAGNGVNFKAGALTNNGEFTVDAGGYQGGTFKVIDLDGITGAEIGVANIDSKFVYRGDDGDILLSDASKDILKGNSSWNAEFGEAVADAGNGFYMGVNAFNNADKLSAEFRRDESVKEIQLTERLTGKLALERGVTISSDCFFGEEAALGGTDADYTLNVSSNQTWERFEVGGQSVTVTVNNSNSASLQAHTLNIFSGAEVIVTDGATLYASEVNTSGATTGGTLNNWGTITLEAGSALQVGRGLGKPGAIAGWFNNYGLIDVNAATITVTARYFKNEGTITVNAGSTVETSEDFVNKGTFNLNWNATLKMGYLHASSISITINLDGFDNKERAIVVVNNQTLDEATVISIVGQEFYNKYKGYLRYEGNTLYLKQNDSAEVYVCSDWAGKGAGETVDYNGNTYTIGTNAFGTVSDAQSVNPLTIHIVGGTMTGTTVLDGQKTILEGDATYTGVATGGKKIKIGIDNRITVDGNTNITVNGGTFKSNLIGADSVITGAARRNGNVTLTINGGNFERQVAGGMYFYAQNPFDEAVLVGDVNLTINGGTFNARVYGGNFAYLDNEFAAQTKLIGDINLTINATSEITFNEHVTAGSRGTGRIYGDVNVTVTGDGSKLNFTGKLIGDSNAGGYYTTSGGYREQSYVTGDRQVTFANFQGNFNAELLMFTTITLDGSTNMSFTNAALNLSSVSEWNFNFGTVLNFNAGENDFTGDDLAFGLDGWNDSDWGVLNGADASMIAGWDKAGSVTFIKDQKEYTASWDADLSAWCSTDLEIKFGLDDDRKSLIISKLA